MDDPLRLRAEQTIGVYVSHDIVAYFPLPAYSVFIIDIILMCFKLLYLFIRDIKTQLLLAPSQSYPQPAPGTEFTVR